MSYSEFAPYTKMSPDSPSWCEKTIDPCMSATPLPPPPNAMGFSALDNHQTKLEIQCQTGNN